MVSHEPPASGHFSAVKPDQQVRVGRGAIGVLLSAYWIFGSAVGIATLQVQEGRRQANSFLALCLLTRHDRDWCEAEYARRGESTFRKPPAGKVC
jgi:hypothetical protein